jgi:geranylgeranyl diphosphate synthase type II
MIDSENTNIRSLQDLLSEYRKYASGISWTRDPGGLYIPVGYMMSLPGKALRPISLLMMADFFQKDLGPALKASYALELFHNFTLVHDDIMDQSEIRRGQQTVYKKFGANEAILSGDVMMIDSLKMLHEVCRDSGDYGIMDAFYQTAIEVCEGQDEDMAFEGQLEVPMGKYLEMIRKKTSVLLGSCFYIGSRLAGMPHPDCEKARELGVTLGLAFQIHDDWLDFFGDSSLTGKVKGGDVLRCKKSVLILKTLEAASAEQRPEILRDYNRTFPEKIEKFDSIFRELDTRESVHGLFMSYRNQCEAIISSFNCLTKVHQSRLREFMEMLLNRTY